MTNILIALKNIVNNPITDISIKYSAQGKNRANNMGEALEKYIKDIFCNTFDINNEVEKNNIYSKTFSYLGNQNNPPDIMLTNGDAIEVKKIENIGSQIALNSSFPKDKLYSDNLMITQECRDCEDWKEKDLIYIIGAMQQEKLKEEILGLVKKKRNLFSRKRQSEEKWVSTDKTEMETNKKGCCWNLWKLWVWDGRVNKWDFRYWTKRKRCTERDWKVKAYEKSWKA